MTEPIVPDPLADGIVSGSVDPSALPADLRGVAEMVAAAHQPPTEGELVGMASVVGAFRVAVTSTAPAVDSEPPRSVVTMFSTRIPKRAAIIVAATLLVAGTAAAAAGGVIPPPFAGTVPGRPAFLEPLPGDDTTTTETTLESGDTTTTGETTTTESGDTTTTTESGDTTTTVDPAATETTYPGRDFGHCTAWGVGAPKSTETPGFRSLGESAEAAGLTVEEYCELVLAAHDGDDTDDADDADDADDGTEVSATSTSDDDANARPAGNGNGNGNGRGNGKGKP